MFNLRVNKQWGNKSALMGDGLRVLQWRCNDTHKTFQQPASWYAARLHKEISKSWPSPQRQSVSAWQPLKPFFPFHLHKYFYVWVSVRCVSVCVFVFTLVPFTNCWGLWGVGWSSRSFVGLELKLDLIRSQVHISKSKWLTQNTSRMHLDVTDQVSFGGKHTE